ncbi:hypothetical protein BN1708_007267 [Verticillium longisporum]|uniref:Copper transport protein n=1 Tax=Verticillium longisporum TaxID=100787 RepID=A0A0G4MS77_VERLO|nr:hypothetical protein BN1708_007267 [Verticillium longisporum]
MASGVRQFPTIKAVRSYVIDGVGAGGDYHNVKGGHWLIDSPISTPSSRWEKYRKSRTSWGINVLGSFFVEIEATDGTVGFATGFGGPPACWLVHQHFERFLIGADPRDTNLLFEQMYRSSMFYGRKGLPIAIISVIDLALWDLLGKLRNEPLIRAVLHTTFFGLAYIIMLLAMYYNGYIIISILLGAGLGKFLCDWLVYKVETGAATQQAKGVEEPTGCCG